jgi:uncharacterized protein
MADVAGFLRRFMKRHAPSREEVIKSPWLKPFGKRIRQSDLWRFTRRSVPRAVAIGLFVGIFLMIPGLQIVGAILVAMPLRANVPVAAAMTFLSNPATTPFFLVAAIDVGNRLGFHANIEAYDQLRRSQASIGEWVRWLLSDAAPAMMSGLAVIGAVAALAGYVVALFGWRWWVARRWRERKAQ